MFLLDGNKKHILNGNILRAVVSHANIERISLRRNNGRSRRLSIDEPRAFRLSILLDDALRDDKVIGDKSSAAEARDEERARTKLQTHCRCRLEGKGEKERTRGRWFRFSRLLAI